MTAYLVQPQNYKEFSERKLDEIKKKIKEQEFFSSDNLNNLCIYTTGSLARLEATEKSDLDIFIIGEDADNYNYGKIDEIKIFSELIKINMELKFPEFSNDGEFLKIFKYNEVEKIIGSPNDDHHNWFTARMLLILESKCLYNEEKYNELIGRIIKFYLRDKSKKDFKLYFLLNDILRFWRTLCLNYEVSRTQQKKWEKKNISLKFSRRLTVFATIIYICVFQINSEDRLLEMIKKTPLDRLNESIEKLSGNCKIQNLFSKFKDEYDNFLNLKEGYDSNQDDKSIISELRKLSNSDTFRELISEILVNNGDIDKHLKLFLIS
ncbi:Nucleotidyltransferase domain [Kingella potus]|uniref:Nucleotidyltransferase domain n=2 Tax=Kingella potus TaxID=265175 RepID=A0A377R3K3_9NEIS|nr:nucleotidyltransferase domain-containing protein [Kingella potus]UOP00075.1 nucleotidyltransferase domain-containing protein [Kingella potus]STR03367.1 Nucleotidyltransferase domain [Kingella potus]